MKAFAIGFGVMGIVFLAYVFVPQWIARSVGSLAILDLPIGCRGDLRTAV